MSFYKWWNTSVLLLWLLIIIAINWCYYWLLLLLLLSLPCHFEAYNRGFLANKLFPKWIFKRVTDVIIQNASGTFHPWQYTGIQSVLFNISKLPPLNPAKKHGGRWWTVIYFWSHTEDSAIMNDVQTREFCHQERGLRRKWLFWSWERLRPDEQTGRWIPFTGHLSQRWSLSIGFKLWLSLTSRARVHGSDMNTHISPSHRASIFQRTLTW